MDGIPYVFVYLNVDRNAFIKKNVQNMQRSGLLDTKY